MVKPKPRNQRATRNNKQVAPQNVLQNKENALPQLVQADTAPKSDNQQANAKPTTAKADPSPMLLSGDDFEILLDSDTEMDETSKPSTSAPTNQLKSETAATAQPAPARLTPQQLLLQHLLDPFNPAAPPVQLRPQLQQVCDKLCEVLCNAVELGHSNSVLMMGPRGAGKTLALERCLQQLHGKYNKVAGNPQVGVLRLTGLMHADDRTAVKEIARQLCSTFGGTFLKGASFADNLVFLKEIFMELKRCDKFLVFVLDEFDLFAHRSKQTLLYTLLDIMRHSQAQAVVVGVTCRLDAVELLEKRVQSRFSHRKLLVHWGAQDAGNRVVDVMRSMLQLPCDFHDSRVAASWNAAVDSGLDSASLKDRLTSLSFTGCSPRQLAQICVMSLAGMGQATLLAAQHITSALQEMSDMNDSQASMVSSLSILELYLIIALHRLTRNNVDIINFEACYEEYAAHASRMTGSVDSFTKAAALRAFEHLLSLGLLAPAAGRLMRSGVLEYQAVRLVVDEEELRGGLCGHPNLPDTLKQWMDQQAVANTAHID